MPRAAANDPTYRFELIDKNTGAIIEDEGIDLISSTSVIKSVMGGSFGAAAWWGFKVAAGALLETNDLASPEVLEMYERLKSGKVTPNTIRDEGGSRGNASHGLLENFALGKEDPASEIVAAKCQADGYQAAALKWWLAQKFDNKTPLLAEKKVRYFVNNVPGQIGYMGTADLIRNTALLKSYVPEVVDYKTHKPATKKFPAYPEDLIQLASYRLAYAAMAGIPVEKVRQRVVVLTEDGEYLEDTRSVDPQVFLALLEIYWAIDGTKR